MHQRSACLAEWWQAPANAATSRSTIVNQSGAVLVLGLVLLLVITLIGVSGLRTTVMQERMAGNLRQNNIALQATEAAIQAGLAYVESLPSVPIVSASGSNYLWPACTVSDANAGTCQDLEDIVDNWQQGDITSINAGATYQDIIGELGESGNLPGVVAQPRIYIEVHYVAPLDAEHAAQGKGVYYFTVTAVGFGASQKARAIVQSTVAKIFEF
ncbi:MAG: hypothetical protein N838_16215 [Thiohalocapsa sp. PB-PSB1]|nr:MAG: hypothetical protein N838_16215 [Thiohalocapsa sp. PB-PSB1]